MNYQELAQREWPIGSGAVESGCRGRQGRRKRLASFGRAPGCGTWMRWKKPAITAIGMNSGSPLNGDSAKVRPESMGV